MTSNDSNPSPLNPLFASQLDQILEAAEKVYIRIMFSTHAQDSYIHCFVKDSVTPSQIKQSARADVQLQRGQWTFPAISLEEFCSMYEEGLVKNQIRPHKIIPEEVDLLNIIISYKIEGEPGKAPAAAARKAYEAVLDLTRRMHNALSKG